MYFGCFAPNCQINYLVKALEWWDCLFLLLSDFLPSGFIIENHEVQGFTLSLGNHFQAYSITNSNMEVRNESEKI